MGAQIGEDFGFERQEAAIPVERKAGPNEAVAAMGGGNEILAAVPDPPDLAAQPPRRWRRAVRWGSSMPRAAVCT